MDLLDLKRAEILAAARRHRARQVYVFGSVARGDAQQDSDVDLLIDFEPGITLVELAQLKHELESILERNVDIVSSMSLPESLKTQIEKDAVRL
ncbi:nucleotidyltransferase [Anaerolineae bacterium CFX9]|nr:nucleotidyltransferase [Anaerolineae bacterium CFX9]